MKLRTGHSVGSMDVDRIADQLRSDGFVAVQRTRDGDVRGDMIRWLDGVNEADHAYLIVMEELRVALNERLYLGLCGSTYS